MPLRPSQEVEWLFQNKVACWGPEPVVMGIVNVTPDSFSDGGQFVEIEQAVDHAQRLVDAGAHWLDIGGESTRPGAQPVPEEEEARRVIPVIQRLAKRVSVPISIDTFKPGVARLALDAGASLINDVTGFREQAMIDLAAQHDHVGLICMHMKGTPITMQSLAHYNDVVGEMIAYFDQRLGQLENAGVDRRRVMLDPGIGFAKQKWHNLAIFQQWDRFLTLGRPMLLGSSRKSLLGHLTGREPDQRLAGSVTTAVYAYLKGCQAFRVHDVAAVMDALKVVRACENPDAFADRPQ